LRVCSRGFKDEGEFLAESIRGNSSAFCFKGGISGG
jgi:hypothetical protein